MRALIPVLLSAWLLGCGSGETPPSGAVPSTADKTAEPGAAVDGAARRLRGEAAPAAPSPGHTESPVTPTAPGAGTPSGPPQTPPTDQPSGPEPDYVKVDHILIGVIGPRLPTATRTDAQARAFAYELLAKIQAGADWDALKAEHSDDRGPGRPPGGPYVMANIGLPAPPQGFQRDRMAPAFGDVGFHLPVGGIGIADHDATRSPFGYHIIKRLPFEYQTPERAGVQHIIIQWAGATGAPPSVTRSKDDARSLAAEVAAKARAEGADWAALVQAHTDDANSAAREGWLGVATAGKIPPQMKPVADAAFALEVGGVSDVVETAFGFHVIRRGAATMAVRASHILVNWAGAERAPATVTRTREEARARAENVLARVQAGEDFAALARELSDGPSGPDGGDVGYLKRVGGFAWPFERAAFGLKPGAVSGLVETRFGWHIIKRTQ